ncbi:MAG: chemotaxis protein CheA [candidate division WS1 bacterium]|nr:chemotaxis protein CheA [candidate division WS1 bacterium]
MPSGFDASEFFELFVEEARELIQSLDEAVIALEHQPQDSSLIEQIFRAAHSLKASAASQGLEQMSHISHAMENVFDLIRNSRLQANAELVDLLLRGVDALKEHLGSAIGGQVAPDHGELLTLLQDNAAITDTERATEAASAPDQVAPGPPENMEPGPEWEPGTRQITITLDECCSMPLARAWLIIQQLQGLGQVAATSPSLEQLQEADIEFTDIHVYMHFDMDVDTFTDTVQAWPDVTKVTVMADDGDSGDDLLPLKPLERRVGAHDRRQGLPDTRENRVERRSGTPDRRQSAGHGTLRVNVEHMDALMNLVGELVINRTRLTNLTQNLKSCRGGDLAVLSQEFDQVVGKLGMVVTEIQERVMQTRMVPVAQLFGRFPRLIRDVARREDKQVDLVMEGGETELDRSLIEDIVDPLTHLLRNAVSHGLEATDDRHAVGKSSTGTVRLSARQQQNMVVIEVGDDGRGISGEKIAAKAIDKGLLAEQQTAAMSEQQLLEIIFMPGFSTVETVSDVSGRGVGMDVVKANMDKIGGMVEVSSHPGQGTTISLYLPLTLAIIQGLLVVSHQVIFALPLPSVVRILRVEQPDISRVSGRPMIVVEDEALPLVSLSEVSEFQKSSDQDADRVIAVVITDGRQKIGLLVDEVRGNEELVIQPLGEQLKGVRVVNGAAILGDGTVALIADVPMLMRLVSGNERRPAA